jgi:hypothetical protein
MDHEYAQMNLTRPNILFITDDQHRYDCLGMVDAFPVNTTAIEKLKTTFSEEFPS